MYQSGLFLSLVRASGFEIQRELDGLGGVHTLLVCRAV
jgi:hypothetical protein